MPAPEPPPKPDELRLSIISEESSQASPLGRSRATSVNGPSTNGANLPTDATRGPAADAAPPMPTPLQAKFEERSEAPGMAVNGVGSNGGAGSNPSRPVHRSSSSGSIERQFVRPRRVGTGGTGGSAGSMEQQRIEPLSLTPRAMSRKQSQRRFVLSDGNANIRAGDAELELEEEQYGVYAQNLIKLLPKPRAVGSEDKLTFQDAISYFMRINRIRKSVGEILDANLCPTCTSLDLKAEKFIVQDRERSRKDAKLGRGAINLKKTTGRFEVGSGSPSCRLGNLKSIWKKSVICPFCRLIIHSLREQENTEWLSTEAWSPQSENDLHRPRELEAVCYASWRVDGRELVEPSGSDYESSKARTRRISLHWQPPGIFRESFLVLVGTETLPETFLGRRVELGPCNPKLMRSWINFCCADPGHSRCQAPPDKRFELMISQAFFGVIDVQEMRLVRLPLGARYVALSYTWGGDQQPYRAVLENVRKLQAPRGIDTALHKLPRTIRDTIDLVRVLGERYLWVDSMCIVQDSQRSWELNASVMDLVYGHAWVTVCAADGDKPSTGLHGMDPRQRHFSQHMEDYAPGVRLMVSFLAESYIENSAWNTRCWTFQERLLSKRCLIFTDSRVFFQCRSATMREDITGEESRGWSIEHAHAPWQILDDLNSRAILLYKRSVEKYTSRNLSRPENILSAFQGIVNMIGNNLSPKHPDFLFGLPRSHFDWALLWEPQTVPEERLIGEGADAKMEEGSYDDRPIGESSSSLNATSKPDENHVEDGCATQSPPGRSDAPKIQVKDYSTNSRRKSCVSAPEEKAGTTKSSQKSRIFPSWSWCGWRDAVMEYKEHSTLVGTTTNLHEWLMTRTWITWYFRDGHGGLKLVWDSNRYPPDPARPADRWTGYRAPGTGPGEGEQLDAYGRVLRSKWSKCARSTFEKTIPEYPFGVLVSEESNEPDIPFPDQRFLQFWTWSAYLRISEQPPPANRRVLLRSASASGTPGTGAGDGRAMRRYGISDYKGDWCGTLMLDPRRGRTFDFSAEQEFIAISEAKDFVKEEYDSWEYYIPKGRRQVEWDLFYVLLIEVRDEIAYRVGLGKVFKEAFENSCREEKKWKEIILG